MSVKTSADVLIGGKIYTLSGYESEEYLQKVANYINSKINEFDEMEQFRRLAADMKSTLLELNIADDYFKAKEQAEKLEETVREKEREIYELQHDLISAKIRVESSEKLAGELEKENRELLLNKSKLEASLEDALLGKVKGQVVQKDSETLNQGEDQAPVKQESEKGKAGRSKSDTQNGK
ncbi:MAG: cell division protein ZapA [Lachnospiraceae bacterium]|nr:cell division protein ZapA [Lachnospiraceae bacterium]